VSTHGPGRATMPAMRVGNRTSCDRRRDPVAAAFQALSGLAWAAPLPRGGPPMTSRSVHERAAAPGPANTRRQHQQDAPAPAGVTADDESPEARLLPSAWGSSMRRSSAPSRARRATSKSRIAVAAPAEAASAGEPAPRVRKRPAEVAARGGEAYISATKFPDLSADGPAVLYELVQLLTFAGKEDQAREFLPPPPARLPDVDAPFRSGDRARRRRVRRPAPRRRGRPLRARRAAPRREAPHVRHVREGMVLPRPRAGAGGARELRHRGRRVEPLAAAPRRR
jgi:hypothetical protein